MRCSIFGFGLCLAMLVAGPIGASAQDTAKSVKSAKAAKAKHGPKTVAAGKGNCVTKYGRGWAFTLDGAKFQAWEIVAQTTGNWPFQTDVFKNEKYTCKPEGSQFRCDSRIDVCKKA